MKFIQVIAILAIIVFSMSVNAQKDFKDIATQEEMKKAKQCIADAKSEVDNVTNLVKKISDENYEGAIEDIFKVTKGLFSMLKNCKTLFCFGPSIEKCNKDNSQGCEQNGLVIYPKCKEGYTNFGCCVCATQCPEGYTDNGLFCLKPSSYGRGVGYVLWQEERCKRENSQGCEKNGLMWYPKCKPGFHNVGCCVCSPDCPEGWTDIGISCQKPSSYGRGVGYPVTIGGQCIKQHAEENAKKLEKQECLLLKEKMDSMKKTVDAQKQSLNQNDDGNSDLPDNLKKLGEMVDQYAAQCMSQN